MLVGKQKGTEDCDTYPSRQEHYRDLVQERLSDLGTRGALNKVHLALELGDEVSGTLSAELLSAQLYSVLCMYTSVQRDWTQTSVIALPCGPDVVHSGT